MLLGSNGYEYSGYTYESTEHRRATTADGKDGCLECHFKATDRLVVGGHSFNMQALNDPTILNVDACLPCHGAIKDFSEVGPGYSVQDSVDVLIQTLKNQLLTAELVGYSASDHDTLPKAVTTSKDSAGAVWNWLMASEDRSHGVHNAKYIMGLLNSSINFMSTPPPSATVVRVQRGMSGGNRR
jgi:hypothetical protein